MASIGSIVKGQDMCDVKLVLWALKVSGVIGSVYIPVATFFTLFLYGIIVNRMVKGMSDFGMNDVPNNVEKHFLQLR